MNSFCYIIDEQFWKRVLKQGILKENVYKSESVVAKFFRSKLIFEIIYSFDDKKCEIIHLNSDKTYTVGINSNLRTKNCDI